MIDDLSKKQATVLKTETAALIAAPAAAVTVKLARLRGVGPETALSRWFTTHFASNGKRMRRIGIVALARKLLVAFWKWLHYDTPPTGALIRAG